jgi:hypothetical protein
MAETLSANRVVAGDPAMIALLLSSPEAADFLPQTELQETGPGRVSGIIQLTDGEDRTLDVVSAAPRRTPTAYIASFGVHIQGLPDATGALRVMSAGPDQSRVDFTLTSGDEIPAELRSLFEVVVSGFFDGLERAVHAQHPAA